jgi:trehalose 6-phosphate phosphatase
MTMQVLSPRLDLPAFLGKIPAARVRVLMLDYDGTLAPFHVRPEDAVPYSGVTQMLDQLMREGATRVVIVTGRRAQELAALLSLGRMPEIWGAHGWERLLPDGTHWIQQPRPEIKDALSDAETAVRGLVQTGARIEQKPASIALHWRGLPPETAARIQGEARRTWSALKGTSALEMLPFDGGLELRARGTNKQHAVKAVLSETAEDSAIAYLGDDITDEDAFFAVKARGIAVLVRPEFRRTAADVWIRPPGELLEFMGHWRVRRKGS